MNPIKSGILNFDEEFKGFNLGSLVFLGGFPNSGKSILLRSFGANFIRQGLNISHFQMEGFKDEVTKGYLSNLADKPYSNILDNSEIIKKVINKYDLNLRIHKCIEFGIRVQEIMNKIREDHKKGINIFLIDYIQIIEYEKNSKGRLLEDKALIEMVKQFVDLAKELNILILSPLSLYPSIYKGLQPISIMEPLFALAKGLLIWRLTENRFKASLSVYKWNGNLMNEDIKFGIETNFTNGNALSGEWETNYLRRLMNKKVFIKGLEDENID